jgi:hypothetical protein
MIKSKEEKTSKVEIDLTGPQGNVFVLIGYAKNFAKQLGLEPNEIQKEMMSGDYENAVNVFDKYFGEFVILYR